MDFNSIKVYLKLTREQRAERKKVMNFVKRIKKAEKHKEKVRKNSLLALPSP